MGTDLRCKHDASLLVEAARLHDAGLGRRAIAARCFLSIRSDQKYHQELNIPMICFCTSRSRDMASLRT